MADPFIAEIKMFGGNFAPRGYAFCNGQLISISQNTALFSLLGTTYGGDGRTTFGLPDLRSRVPMGTGRGPGLSDRRLGERDGQEAVTLNVAQLPSHGHLQQASSDAASAAVGPAGAPAVANTPLYATAGTMAAMADEAVAPAGGGQAHNNTAPSLAVSFIIALVGTFPSRN